MKCRSLMRNGSPCPREALDGREGCAVHDPEERGRRAIAGGLARSSRVAATAEELEGVDLGSYDGIRRLLDLAVRLASQDRASAGVVQARALIAVADAALRLRAAAGSAQPEGGIKLVVRVTGGPEDGREIPWPREEAT